MPNTSSTSPSSSSPVQPQPPIPPPTIIPELQTLRDSLQLIFHRNRNQHRRSIWWRSLAGFRRAIQHLLMNMETLNAPVQLCKAEDVRPMMERRAVAERSVRMQLSVWRDYATEKWFCAFSNLVASSQFSSLGLILLSALARSSSLLGVTTALQMQSKNNTSRKLNIAASKECLSHVSRHQYFDDHGEVVERDSIGNLPAIERNPSNNIFKVDASETSSQFERNSSSDQHSERYSPRLEGSEIDIPRDHRHIEETDKVENSNASQPKIEEDAIDVLFEGLA